MGMFERAADALRGAFARGTEPPKELPRLGAGGPPVGLVFEDDGQIQARKGRYGWSGRQRVTTPALDANTRTYTAIFDEADRGDTRRLQDLYEDTRLRDPRLDAVAATRVLAIQSRPWVVRPPDGMRDDREAQDIAKRVTRILQETKGFGTARGHLGNGCLVSFAVLEFDWRVNARRERYPLPKWRHSNRFVIDEADRVAKCDPGVDAYPGVPLSTWPDKFLVHSPVGGRSTYIQRRGALRSVVLPALTRRFGLKWWLSSLERWGQPQVYATVKQGELDGLTDRLLNMFKKLSSDWQAVVPEGVTLGTIDATISDTLHKNFIELYNLDVAIAILGQNLTTEVQGGSYAAAAVADRIRGDILAADLSELDETITEQWIEPLVRYNWPGAPVPVFESQIAGQRPITQSDYVTGAFRRNEYRASLGYEAIDGEEGDEFYVPPSAQPAANSGPSAILPALPSGEPAGAVKPAETALNGAQIEALQSIIANVAAGLIPRDTGIQLITAGFPITVEKAEQIMGTVGAGFVPAVQDPDKGAPATQLKLGDRVQVVPGKEHMPEHAGKTGTVAEVQGTSIGIQFDGESEVHRWYAPDELTLVSAPGGAPTADPLSMSSATNTSSQTPSRTKHPLARALSKL